METLTHHFCCCVATYPQSCPFFKQAGPELETSEIFNLLQAYIHVCFSICLTEKWGSIPWKSHLLSCEQRLFSERLLPTVPYY